MCHRSPSSLSLSGSERRRGVQGEYNPSRTDHILGNLEAALSEKRATATALCDYLCKLTSPPDPTSTEAHGHTRKTEPAHHTAADGTAGKQHTLHPSNCLPFCHFSNPLPSLNLPPQPLLWTLL